MARLMLSAGIFSDLAARMAVRSRGLESGSPLLMRAATVISLISLVNIFPRRASSAPFLCLMVAHFECPDIMIYSFQKLSAWHSQPVTLWVHGVAICLPVCF